MIRVVSSAGRRRACALLARFRFAQCRFEALRHFQQAAVFRVAVADLSGRLPLMRVSDRLTDIAELIIERVVELSLRQICAQWGVPKCGDGPQRPP